MKRNLFGREKRTPFRRPDWAAVEGSQSSVLRVSLRRNIQYNFPSTSKQSLESLVKTIRKLTTMKKLKTLCNTPGTAQVQHRFLTRTSAPKNEKSFQESCSHTLRTETPR